MREATKVTVKYQFLKIILTQAAASGIAVVFGTVAFWYFTDINILKQILSGIFMFVNFVLLFIQARKFAAMDIKPYTNLKPSVIKGVMLGVSVAAINVIFAFIFRLLWVKYGSETGIAGVFPTIYNAFFYLWSFPYNGIMELNHGNFTFFTWIFMTAVPIAATTAGYITGVKKIDVMEKINSLIYEKED